MSKHADQNKKETQLGLFFCFGLLSRDVLIWQASVISDKELRSEIVEIYEQLKDWAKENSEAFV